MVALSNAMLLMILFASAVTVLAMLRVFTNIIEHETELHDLRTRVKQLQFDQQLYLARISGQIPEESSVEIIDDDPEIVENADPIEAVELASDAADEVESAIDGLVESTQAA